MSANARSATGDSRILSEIVVRDETVPRAITEGFVRESASVLRQFWGGTAGGGGAPSAAANPDYVSGAISARNARPVTTNETTVAAPAGSTFSWSSAAGWTVNTPSSATTRFIASNVEPGEERTQMFVCTVTGPSGGTATASVTASASNYYDGGSSGPLP